MELLTCFEYEAIEHTWTVDHLTSLDSFNRLYGEDVLKVHSLNGKIAVKTTQYVGVFQLDDITIRVLPKMYRTGDGNPQTTATRNFFYLLQYTDLSSVKFRGSGDFLAEDLDWFEILTRMFAEEMRRQWYRGAYRTYQPVEDISPILTGKWRLSDQFCHPEQKNRFFIEKDEFTADNALNRVFRYVIERLWFTTTDAGNRRLLGELRQDMAEVSLLPDLSLTMANSIPITRLNQSYESLLELAKLFLAHRSLQLSSGRVKTFAFCFNMNRVFENFVTEFIIRHQRSILPDFLQGCQLFPQANRHTQYLAKDRENRPVFQLRPDLIFSRGGNYPALLDTKYKRLQTEKRNLAITSNDFYQMFAYIHRYNCPLAIVVYPHAIDGEERLDRTFRIEGTDQRVKVGSIDLSIDFSDPTSHDLLIRQFQDLFQE
jgi:5-methylcytosine-specific restriction enzyme subunit McrC